MAYSRSQERWIPSKDTWRMYPFPLPNVRILTLTLSKMLWTPWWQSSGKDGVPLARSTKIIWLDESWWQKRLENRKKNHDPIYTEKKNWQRSTTTRKSPCPLAPLLLEMHTNSNSCEWVSKNGLSMFHQTQSPALCSSQVKYPTVVVTTRSKVHHILFFSFSTSCFLFFACWQHQINLPGREHNISQGTKGQPCIDLADCGPQREMAQKKRHLSWKKHLS